jgi:uncharacterized membrane protein YeaQ/YmgE (transglycosylase-associated protein family)
MAFACLPARTPRLDLPDNSIKLPSDARPPASALKDDEMGILAALLIGAIAGWLAGLIVRGAGFGLIGNIVIGIIGALVAGWLLPKLNVTLATGTLGSILDATVGAVIVLVILSLIRR